MNMKDQNRQVTLTIFIATTISASIACSTAKVFQSSKAGLIGLSLSDLSHQAELKVTH